MEETSGMTEKELKDQAIREYANILRIANASDKEKEIERQKTILKVRLQSLGISTEDLETI